MVTVFAEVRRVLRSDGTCWVNMGDSYAAAGGHSGQGESSIITTQGQQGARNFGATRLPEGMSDGNRLGIPERFVLALQADGWTWRSTVVWAKRAPMPESVSGTRWEQHRVKVSSQNLVGNRKIHGMDGRRNPDESRVPEAAATWSPCPGCPQCVKNDGLVLRRGSWRATRSFEVIYMLTKGAGYYSDETAVKEAATSDGHNSRSEYAVGNGRKASFPRNATDGSRNPRDVQWFAPKPLGRIAPYSEPVDVAHYAAYPPELPDWCIRASTSERGVCATCGAPWARVVEHHGATAWQSPGYTAGSGRNDSTGAGTYLGADSRTLGWKATCAHQGEPVGAMVLDPYSGTGTTGLAALRLGRRYIGIELNPQYAALSRARITADSPMLNGA